MEFFADLQEPFSISAITVVELYAGVKGKDERRQLDRFISTTEVLSVGEKIARVGGMIKKGWYASHGVGLADALVAATARQHGLSLVTLNEKHFPMVEALVVPYRRQ